MASDKQIAANRANAQKSTGPKTSAGKQRSSLNALRHGLTGQVVVLPGEDLEAYKIFTGAIVETFHPHDAREIQLAHSYAGFQWRINRAAAVEDTLFTVGLMEDIAGNLNLENAEVHNAASNAKTFRQDAHVFDRLSLYTHRLVTGAQKVLKELEALQARRRDREAAEMLEASRLYRLHIMQNSSFDPCQNGFAFSLDQIASNVRRLSLNTQAETAEKYDWSLPKYMRATGQAA